MPYANFYLESLQNDNHDIHLLTWNRDGAKDSFSPIVSETHEFDCIQENQVSHKYKIINFIKYKRFVHSVLNDVKPDFIICLHTFPCFLMFDKLIFKYRKQYIFDYRDYTYEKNPLFKGLIGFLVKNSSATFVSSDAFRTILPNTSDLIFTSHNINEDLIRLKGSKSFILNKSKVIIRFWGFVRNESLNKAFIRAISNDSRFELHYHGKEETVVSNLKHYAFEELKSYNIFFHGEYMPDDRFVFSEHTDLLHNVYDDPNMLMAVSNKYYDGVFFEIPQLCLCNSYMGKLVDDGNIGISIDPYDPNFPDIIYDYYYNLDISSFLDSCQNIKQQIEQQYFEAEKHVRDIINQAR